MGYIICEECGDYYELQPGEHPEDFSRCHCGGKLRYERQMIDDYDAPSPESGFKLPTFSKNLKILGTGAVLIIITLIKYLPIILGFLMANVSIQTFSQYGIPYQYLVPVVIVITVIIARIFNPGRR